MENKIYGEKREESQPYDQKMVWIEENLAKGDQKSYQTANQELPYKQKDVEQAFITSERRKLS